MQKTSGLIRPAAIWGGFWDEALTPPPPARSINSRADKRNNHLNGGASVALQSAANVLAPVVWGAQPKPKGKSVVNIELLSRTGYPADRQQG